MSTSDSALQISAIVETGTQHLFTLWHLCLHLHIDNYASSITHKTCKWDAWQRKSVSSAKLSGTCPPPRPSICFLMEAATLYWRGPSTEWQDSHFTTCMKRGWYQGVCCQSDKPIWQYFWLKPNSNREPDKVNEGKGVGYLSLSCSSSSSSSRLLLVPSPTQTE